MELPRTHVHLGAWQINGLRSQKKIEKLIQEKWENERENEPEHENTKIQQDKRTRSAFAMQRND